MKRTLLSLALVFAAMSSLPAADSRLDFQPADTTATVLSRQVGQLVELQLKSGQKIGGKVEKVGEKLVHLSTLSQQEFFEAVVVLDTVSAVVVRAKAK